MERGPGRLAGSLSAVLGKPKARRSLALSFYGMTQHNNNNDNGFATWSGEEATKSMISHGSNIPERIKLLEYEKLYTPLPLVQSWDKRSLQDSKLFGAKGDARQTL